MFIPHSENEREEMLGRIGKEKMEDLFLDIPEKFRFPHLDLPPALTESEVLEEISTYAEANNAVDELICFLGAGVYHHYIPSVVDAVLSRGDFFTAYTPYQPEISQGTLQAIFEFQSLICSLTGMEISNASHYDGATAAAETCLSAYHHFRGKRKKIITSCFLHPHYRQTIRTYLSVLEGIEIVEQCITPDDNPLTNMEDLIDENTALVFVQYPDFLGRIFDYSDLTKLVHEKGALLAVAANPISLGMLIPPADFSADFVVGEGQPLGIPMNFGGPYLGFFATKNDFLRKVSGRIVGQTEDANGNRGFVLTLTAREQHIRRERAISNICTNQGLMALAATVYLSVLGKHGLRQVAELCYHKAHYAAENIAKIRGFSVESKVPFFNEFVVTCPRDPDEINTHLLAESVLGGYSLKGNYPDLSDKMLIAVTEMNTKEEIDLLVELLTEIANE
jgi:glycine dehydrogenase subunit 1